MAGHSFGGFTALATGAGFQDVPPDPRVRVLVPISPAAGGLTDQALAGTEQVELVLGGTSDVTVPVEPSNTRAFELPGARPRYRVDVLEAGHNSFTDICAFIEVLLAVGLPQQLLDFLLGTASEGCGPDLIPVLEAHRVTRLYATAFLRRHLAADARYEVFLTPSFAAREPAAFFLVSAEPECGLGVELLLVLPALDWLHGRRFAPLPVPAPDPVASSAPCRTRERRRRTPASRATAWR